MEEEVVESLPGIFEKEDEKRSKETDKEKDELFRQIGIMKIENEWLKKSWTPSSGKQRHDRAGS